MPTPERSPRLDIELFILECPDHPTSSIALSLPDPKGTKASISFSQEECQTILDSLKNRAVISYLEGRHKARMNAIGNPNSPSAVDFWKFYDGSLLGHAGEAVRESSEKILTDKADILRRSSRVILRGPASWEAEELRKSNILFTDPPSAEFMERITQGLKKMGISCTCSHSQVPSVLLHDDGSSARKTDDEHSGSEVEPSHTGDTDEAHLSEGELDGAFVARSTLQSKPKEVSDHGDGGTLSASDNNAQRPSPTRNDSHDTPTNVRGSQVGWRRFARSAWCFQTE